MVRFVRSGKNWEGRSWVVNPAVDALCGQVEAAWPQPHAADGIVASKAHDQANPSSDHRPYPWTGPGVVCAVDVGEVTEDDGAVLSEALRVSRDPRLRYVIHEGRMFSSYATPSRPSWAWGPYAGPNPHTNHVHLSVYRTAGAGAWNLDLEGDTMHKHTPMPSDLPRAWADDTWDAWVARSGTIDSTRTNTFYREDLGWVYSRVIAPLEREVSRLAAEVESLKAAAGMKPHTHTFQGTTAQSG